MNTTGIDWCTHTWNPVTGCLHGCAYCYAREIAKRFCTNEHGHEWGTGTLAPCNGKCHDCSLMDGLEFVGDTIRYAHKGEGPFPYGFFPTFYEDRLDEPVKAKRKSRVIFVCSMADLFGKWVPLKYIGEVMGACTAAPHHKYIFLTKNPARYRELVKQNILPRAPGFWYGATVTNQAAAESEDLPLWGECRSFWSVEPLHGPINLKKVGMSYLPRRIIIGAETGRREGKIVPRREWVEDIIHFCQLCDIPYFIKNNLLKLYPDLQTMNERYLKLENFWKDTRGPW